MAGGNRKAPERQPITRHPLFPAVAALWFGALFGLGSLAIRAALLEDAVMAGGIDLIVPAAAPPLGVTARILLALLMASFGSLIGFALGARIARPRIEPVQRRRASLAAAEQPKPRRADRFTSGEAAAPRPLSAFEELGEEDRIAPAAGPSGSGLRRRSLAMLESEGPDYGRDHAPVPGSDYPAAAMADLDAGDVLDLSDALPEGHLMEATLQDDEPIDPAPFSREAVAAPAPAPRLFDGGPTGFAPTNPLVADDSGAFAAAVDSTGPDDRTLPPRNFGQRFAAPSPANEPGDAAVDFDGPEIGLEREESAAPCVVPPQPAPLWSAAAPGARHGSAADHLRSAPLETLSQIELIERLALSLQERRTTAAAAPAVSPEPAAEPAPSAQGVPLAPGGEMPRFGFEPRNPVELDLPSASGTAVAPPASALPAAMRPIDLGNDPDEDEDGAALEIPRFPFAAAPAPQPQNPPSPSPLTPSGEADLDEGDDRLVDESFSSLLGLGRAPLRQPLVRIDEPAEELAGIEPVVVFPGHGSRPFAARQTTTQEIAPQPGARPFDPPGMTPKSTPQAPIAASRQEPEETERALRAALATLQRMSGAA